MDEEQSIESLMREELERLAAALAGASDTGGPVENATQVKGRGDLGVLLTDIDDKVLGRVWVEFGGSAKLEKGAKKPRGSVGVQVTVCSEVVKPPAPLVEWVASRSKKAP